jgi:DNA-binding NtrC family response regulator
MRISDAALRALHAHPWPGNVRELRNLMQYAAAAFPDPELRPEHVIERLARSTRPITGTPSRTPDTPSSPASGFRPLAEEVRELEITRMRAALEATHGNQTRAATLLSVPIRTFSEKVKQYGLPTRKKRIDGTG